MGLYRDCIMAPAKVLVVLAYHISSPSSCPPPFSGVGSLRLDMVCRGCIRFLGWASGIMIIALGAGFLVPNELPSVLWITVPC